MAGADDGTPREGEVEITTVETTSTEAGDAAGAPPRAVDPLTGGPVEEVVPGVASERERVRTLPDGSVERRLDRVEQPAEVRRRSSPNLVPALLIILALALGAIAAAWWFTRDTEKEVPGVVGLSLDQAVQRLQDEGFKSDISSQANEAEEGTVYEQRPGRGRARRRAARSSCSSRRGPRRSRSRMPWG